MPEAAAPAAPAVCGGCGTELAATLLRCPACRALVHAGELTRLTAEARMLEGEGRRSEALAVWRAALELLPPDAPQVEPITRRVTALVSAEPAPAPPPGWEAAARRFGPVLGAVVLLLWKLKFVVAFVLTKAKFLLLGLTKASTFLSMLAAAGVYWTLWGWKFAVGVVLSIYVHEMGHVAALRRYGIAASAPMFIPGFGAVVRLHQHPATAGEDARVGLAGPLWGLGASVAAAGIFVVTQAPIWAAIARFSAWINLFNLLPVWQLDGGRGFRALARHQRWTAVAALLGVWFLTGETLLLLLAVAGGVAACREAAEEPDTGVLATYAALALAFALLTQLPVPGIPR
jgi:Zn-dependent protease